MHRRYFTWIHAIVILCFESLALGLFYVISTVITNGGEAGAVLAWRCLYYPHPLAYLGLGVLGLFFEPDSFYIQNVLFPAISLAIFGGLQWYLIVEAIIRLRRRARLAEDRGHTLCRACEYDLTGNTSGVCPECGTQIPDDACKLIADSQTELPE